MISQDIFQKLLQIYAHFTISKSTDTSNTILPSVCFLFGLFISWFFGLLLVCLLIHPSVAAQSWYSVSPSVYQYVWNILHNACIVRFRDYFTILWYCVTKLNTFPGFYSFWNNFNRFWKLKLFGLSRNLFLLFQSFKRKMQLIKMC